MAAQPADAGCYLPGLLGEQGMEAASEARKIVSDARERSNQNLIKFETGMIQHPDGRRTAGASVKEWYNAYLHINADGSFKWDLEKLRNLIITPGVPPAMIIAAQDVLLAASSGVTYSLDKFNIARMTGINPEVGKARIRLLDRVDGKIPNDPTAKEPDELRTEAEIMAAMISMMDDPELKAFIAAKFAGQVGQPAEKPLLELVDEGSGG